MATVNQEMSDYQKSAVDTAVKFARTSVDNVERLFAFNLEATKLSLDETAKNMQAMSGVSDVQELHNLRSKLAENSLEFAMGYSRNLYEMTSAAQAELSTMLEEQVAGFQKHFADNIDKVAKSAPAGSDVAVAALKSSLAATTALMDSVTKATKQAASYADAGIKAASSGNAKAATGASSKRK